MKKRKVYRVLAEAVAARKGCITVGNTEWENRWAGIGEKAVKKYLPSGGGFDNGCKLDWGKSTGEKLVIHTAFHHMDDGGYYDGWTEHTVAIRPSFRHMFSLSISGRDKNGVKEYIAGVFHADLSQEEVEET